MLRTKGRDIPPQRIVDSTAIVEGSRPYKPPRWRVWVLRLIPLLLVVFVVEIFYLTYGSSAIIRLAPVSLTREQVVSVMATDHPATSTQSDLRHLTATQTTSVHGIATGTSTEPATTASGELLWFNTSATPLRIAALTRVNVGPTLQIETDAEVMIPGAETPGLGQATGPAHIIQTGTIGNIAANTLTKQPCQCGVNALVSNGAFSGGQDEKQVQVIQKSDVEQAVASQQNQLIQKAKLGLRQQAQPEEQLLERNCALQGTPDRSIGSVTSSFTVTVSATCNGVAYNKADVQQKAALLFATTRPSENYHLSSASFTFLYETPVLDGAIQIAINVHGSWAYSFSPSQISQFQQELAGKSPEQGQHILASAPGVQWSQVICWWPWLPSADHIVITAS